MTPDCQLFKLSCVGTVCWTSWNRLLDILKPTAFKLSCFGTDCWTCWNRLLDLLEQIAGPVLSLETLPLLGNVP